MRTGATLLGSVTTASGKIGAGGFTTGLAIANDGTLMCRTDTNNAYASTDHGVSWGLQLKAGTNITAASLDLFYSTASPWGQVGTYDVAIAPSNSAVRYLVCMGYVWVTQDSGATYTKCNLAQQANCAPNEVYRMSGKPLAVDPQNPAVCFFGSPNGLFYTADYGANWTTVSTATIPAPTSGKRMCVAFDPNSSVVSTKKQGIYVFVNGSGLYKTTNGGTSWSTVTAPTNSPTAASHMRVGSNGYVYLGGDGGAGSARFRRWNGTAWTEPTGVICKAIAVSPHNAGHVYIGADGGGLDFSNDYGATWLIGGGNVAANIRVATNIGWQAFTNEDYMTSGDMDFDPSVNRLWAAEGCGIWKMDSPPTSGLTFASSVTWTEMSNGIENMVSANITVAPDGSVGYSCHDRGCMIMPKASAGVTFPAKHGGSRTFQHSQANSFAPEDNNFRVMSSMIGNGQTPPPSAYYYTTDAGANWTAITAMDALAAAGGGGQVCALSKDMWIVAPCGAGKGVWLTTNRGASFTELTIGDNAGILVQQGYNYARRVLIQDPFTSGRAYLYHVGNPDDSSSVNSRGFYTIDVNLTTGTPTVTRKNTSFISASGGYGGPDFYNGKLTAGGAAGEVYWCGGDNCLGLWKTTNSGSSWAKVTGTDDHSAGTDFGEVFGFGVGKAYYSSSYKTLFAAGYRMSSPAGATNADVAKYGFWMSVDNGATWTRMAQFPNGIFDVVNDIAGDPTEWGRFYIGYGGTGLWKQAYTYSLRAS